MSSPTPPKKERKEMSNEIRMLLAFVLMGLILVATPYAYRMLGVAPPASQQPAAGQKAPAEKKAADPAANTAGGAPIVPSAPIQPEPNAAPQPGAIAAPGEQEHVVDTTLYHLVFTNRGA